MSIINTQAVANAKKVLTGKNGALYNAKGKLLATMETYQAQVNVTNTKFQPLGDPQEHEIFTSYGQTLTFTEIVVEDGEFITDLLAGMKSGEMPSWNFQGVIKGRNGSEERLVYNDCVPSGNIDLQNVEPVRKRCSKPAGQAESLKPYNYTDRAAGNSLAAFLK